MEASQEKKNVVVEYLKERKELLYFVGGCGIGSVLGPKGLIWAALLVGVIIFIWIKYSKRKSNTG